MRFTTRHTALACLAVAAGYGLFYAFDSYLDPTSRNAWNEISAIAHTKDTDLSTKPEWLRWFPASQVCLSDNGAGGPAGKTGDPLAISPEFSSMEVPTQVIEKAAKLTSDDKTKFLRNFADKPLITSVLFNEQARDSLCRSQEGTRSSLLTRIENLDRFNVIGIQRTMSDTPIEEGATIVKLMWEVVPVVNSSKIALLDEKNLPLLPSGHQLVDLSNWPLHDLDTSQPDSCSGVGGTTRIPLGCFYHQSIPSTDARKISQLTNNTAAILGLTSGLGKNEVQFVLVGVHIMTFTAKYPNWRWMTFYWALQNNDQAGLKPSWSHYHMRSTDKVREESSRNHRYSYGPYLEGTSVMGTNSNCLSCHQFAAFSSRGDDKTVDGLSLAAVDPLPIPEQPGVARVYFIDSVQTGLVWTIARIANEHDPHLLGKDSDKVMFLKELTAALEPSKEKAKSAN